jgi:hypothetical protein
LEKKSEEFEKEISINIQSISDAMASESPKEIDDAIKLLFGIAPLSLHESKFSAAADNLAMIVPDIKDDLCKNLISPVRAYYGDDFVSTDELKEVLHKTLPPERRDAIARIAEKYRTRYDVLINGYNGKVRKGGDDEEKLKKIENTAHSLFKEMRKGLTERASFILQTRDYSMQQALKILLERGIADIEQRIYKELPEQRLVAVCAAAYLADLGTGSVETNKCGQQSIDNLVKLNIDDGIDRLRTAVNFYIDHERVDVLRNRCDKLENAVKQQAKQVFDLLDPIYGKDLDNNIDEEDLYGEDFGKWWGNEWSKKIKPEFQSWYQNTIEIRAGTDDIAGEHAKLTELRHAYNEQVKILFANLDTAKLETMEMIYKGDTHLVPVPAHGNKAIRDKLYPEIQKVLQQQLPNQLTGSLKAITDEIVNQAKERLFKIDDVERILLKNPTMLEHQIRHGFETLFLRFGRVAVDTFIALPLHDRPRLLQEYEPEIRTLEAFYRGSDKETKGNLTDYLRIGLWIMKEASAMGVVPPIVGEGIKIAEKKWNPFDDKASENSLITSETYEPQNFAEVVKEINGDLMALQNYLQNSVFNAAGFITYSKQELQRIRERFIDLEESDRRWGEVVRREAKRHNPNIPFKIDNRIQDFRLRREIALEIKEARKLSNNLN